VVGKPEQRPQADRLLNLLMDGLRPRPDGLNRAGPQRNLGRAGGVIEV
jgi:hypothetical protein